LVGTLDIRMDEIDWRQRWRGIVEDRSVLAAGHAD